MRPAYGTVLLLVLAVTGCAREQWPAPPAVDAAAYQKEHAAWREEQRAGLAGVLPITGIWPLAEGETPFGSDPALPIALPSAHFPGRAGVFRRAGTTVTVAPDAPRALKLDDGSTLDAAREVDAVSAGPIRLQALDGGDGRRWVLATDTSHSAIANPPAIESYPLDQRWRVAARFDAFDQPKPVRVPDVRGGEMEFTATRRAGVPPERRGDALDRVRRGRVATICSSCSRTRRTSRPPTAATASSVPRAVKDGEWTVVDFNFATQPALCVFEVHDLSVAAARESAAGGHRGGVETAGNSARVFEARILNAQFLHRTRRPSRLHCVDRGGACRGSATAGAAGRPRSRRAGGRAGKGAADVRRNRSAAAAEGRHSPRRAAPTDGCCWALARSRPTRASGCLAR